MKKYVILIFFFVFFITNSTFASIAADNIAGRWAERISERVVMDIYPDKQNEYKIFITWREDNLAQKDIYRFTGKLDNEGNLKYKNGIHIHRSYNDKNSFEEKTDYTNGSGRIKIDNNLLIWFDNKDKSKTEFIRANADLLKDTTVKNKMFSIILPEELKDFYEIEAEKDKISVFHKESKQAGFGGFAFGIKAYKNPSEHAVLPGSKKIGEMTDKKGILYDIVLKYPTDVQYDYTKSSKAPESFKLLYDLGEWVNIEGVNGSKYFKAQGTKGEDLYKDILQKHITAMKEKWGSVKLEHEQMSYMYNLTDKIGYTYYDVNSDGIEELLIGEIADGDWKGVIYDIYTMVNREPKHVISGGSRDRYYVCDNSFICNEYSSGAMESGIRVYILVENSTELFPQVSFKYDGYTNSKNPWFLSYGSESNEDKWENVTEKKYKERKKVFEKYERFNFVPLSKAFENKDSDKQILKDKYNSKKDYFDYSVVLTEFPKNFFYTTVKINKSKERILIITDKTDVNKNAYKGLFYYFAKNGFVYPLGYLESAKPFSQSKNYLYLTDKKENTKFYMSDKELSIIKSKLKKVNEKIENIEFETIGSADKFAGDFGSPAGDDVVKASVDGFYFEYHKSQYKKKYIKKLMKECIKDGVKTQVQMYCRMVKKLHC